MIFKIKTQSKSSLRLWNFSEKRWTTPSKWSLS